MALKFLFTMQISIDPRNNKPARISYVKWNKMYRQRGCLSGFKNKNLHTRFILIIVNLLARYSASFGTQK